MHQIPNIFPATLSLTTENKLHKLLLPNHKIGTKLQKMLLFPMILGATLRVAIHNFPKCYSLVRKLAPKFLKCFYFQRFCCHTQGRHPKLPKMLHSSHKIGTKLLKMLLFPMILPTLSASPLRNSQTSSP